MEKNEIKKELYKQNPIAEFQYIRKGNAHYKTIVKDNQPIRVDQPVLFEVPVSDMGDADFGIKMEAKLLQRWIS
jgi:hypothetical protein